MAPLPLQKSKKMNKLPSINVCPALLTQGFHTYSPEALQRLFAQAKVSHLLPFALQTSQERFWENRKAMSLSGYQDKYSLVLEGNRLSLSQAGKRGGYILKPISPMPKNREFAPANEHLTMQLAAQVFGIETAENAMIFFADGAPAYLVKRFDISPSGDKLAVEDFASLLGRAPQTHGGNYKYDGSYYELFQALKQFLPSWEAQAERLFRLLLFNYLFSNGDAHLKNFSLIEDGHGSFRLSPAYDLLNTRLHIEDTDFALTEGLLPKAQGGIRQQFIALASAVGLDSEWTLSTLEQMTSHNQEVETLVSRSFLSPRLQRNYLQGYQRRVKKIRDFLK